MNEMISDSNLILVFSFIQILIQHLNESLLRVELSLVVLRINVNLVLQLFGFGNSHNFTPISQEFLLVEAYYFVLVFNF